MLLESLLTKLAAAGLATKAAAGGTAVVLAASAAGAADALPEPAQHSFDRLVTVEQTVEEEGLQDEGTDAENSGFGERVSQDATGASDGEPGVDRAEIACEASQGGSGTCDDITAEGVQSDEGSSEDEAFGARVANDATGASDGEPGVDGEEVSSEARANNPGAGKEGADDASAAAGEDDLEDGEEESRERAEEAGGPEGTPGADAAANSRRGDR